MDNELFLSFLSEFGLHKEEFALIGERFYSQVYRAVAKRRVIKIITSHRVLQSEGFHTKSEAMGFAMDILTYMEKLDKLGVSVSPLSETNLFLLGAQSTGEIFLVISALDGGISVETLLERAESSDHLYALSMEMLRILSPALCQPRLADGYAEIGMDGVPSNFALHEGRMTYIDFTPPRYYSPDQGYRVEYPQPVSQAELYEAIWRYYEPCGIITRWLTDCCRIRPDGRSTFLTALQQSIDCELWQFINSQLPSLNLPFDFTTHMREWRIAIESMHKAIDLRDIACAIAYTDSFDARAKQWLNDVFIASRHHPGEPIHEEKLGSLRKTLLDRLKMI